MAALPARRHERAGAVGGGRPVRPVRGIPGLAFLRLSRMTPPRWPFQRGGGPKVLFISRNPSRIDVFISPGVVL
ncbi:Uncharacterised protein [Bordetella pertussis]|nr:Uncharacterised protein [Bordetella pertussis]